jgi:hypothetical protein
MILPFAEATPTGPSSSIEPHTGLLISSLTEARKPLPNGFKLIPEWK